MLLERDKYFRAYHNKYLKDMTVNIDDYVLPGYIEREDIVAMQKINPYFWWPKLDWVRHRIFRDVSVRPAEKLNEDECKCFSLMAKYRWPGLNDIEFENYKALLSRLLPDFPVPNRFYKPTTLAEKWALDGKVVEMTDGTS